MSCDRCSDEGTVLDSAGTAHPCTCAFGRAIAGQVGTGAIRAAWRHSKRRGAAAEQALAGLLLAHGIPAKRIPQRTGGPSTPDVLSDLPLHLEVKSGAKLYAPRALEQAKRDAGGFPAVVFYQSPECAPWVVVLEALDFLELLEFVARESANYLAMLSPGASAAPAGASPGMGQNAGPLAIEQQ